MSLSEPNEQREKPKGAARKLLRMLVKIDSSRFAGKRFGAAAGLIGILGAFGAAGYWLPALILRYFAR